MAAATFENAAWKWFDDFTTTIFFCLMSMPMFVKASGLNVCARPVASTMSRLPIATAAAGPIDTQLCSNGMMSSSVTALITTCASTERPEIGVALPPMRNQSFAPDLLRGKFDRDRVP